MDSQLEFDCYMKQLNDEQTAINIPLKNEKMRIRMQREALRSQIVALHQQDAALKIQFLNIEMQQKEINRVCYQIKKEMLALNPKPSTL